MTEVTNELIYEVLKDVQQRIGNIEHRLGSVDSRLDSLSSQVRGLAASVDAAHVDIQNIYGSVSRTEQHLLRIENRLQILDEPAE